MIDIYAYDVSIIVIMYNPAWDKLLRTLNSILDQRNVRYEIIICDDGSQKRFDNELLSFFSARNFISFSLITRDANHGTVSNYCSGLEKAKGKYTKAISPGDYFSDGNVLSEWIRFMEDRKAAWAFSDAYYYCLEDENQQFLIKRAYPQHIRCYQKGQQGKCRWNYVALRDGALGASILGLTQLQLDYCRKILDAGVIYAEDYMYRLMMFDGIVGCYYSIPAVCYEYGTGISTSGDIVWKRKLQSDTEVIYNIMQGKDDLTGFQKSVIKALKSTKKTEKIFIRGKLYHWLKWNFFPRLTGIPKDTGI